jgi:4'-phosphopantetheinyl transferase
MRPPRPGDCHVWWASTEDADDSLVALLDAVERRRLDRLVRAEDRARFTLACAVLRVALSAYLGQPPASIPIDRRCPRCGRPHGKTRLTGAGPDGLELSVAHSGERVAVAIARDTPVGIDLERVRDDVDVDGLAPAVLSPSEAAELARLDGARRIERFLTLWTRKEAVLKARGTGIAGPLSGVSVTGESVRDLPAGRGYVASLATVGRCCAVVTRDARQLLRSRAAGAPDARRACAC